MSTNDFTKGFLIGLPIAAAVGPIWILCFRRALAEGALVGFVSGLGAATADAMYGAVAAFGLTAISDVLVGMQRGLGIAGGGFLCYLGLRTLASRAPAAAEKPPGGRLLASFASTLALTLSNPMTVISFVAVFAGLGLIEQGRNYRSASLMVAGVFAGSAVWWIILCATARIVRDRLDARWMKGINLLSGMLILGFGLHQLWDKLLR
jgi:threonine/homoserine/homoserine lactone efflux protein